MAITLASTSPTQGTDFSTVASGFTAGTENKRRLVNNAQGRYQMADLSATTMTISASGARLTPGTDRIVVDENGTQTAFDMIVSRAGAAGQVVATISPPNQLTVGDTINVAAPAFPGGTAPFTYRLLDARGLTTRALPAGVTLTSGAFGGVAPPQGLYGVRFEVKDANGKIAYTDPFSLPVQSSGSFYVPPATGGTVTPPTPQPSISLAFAVASQAEGNTGTTAFNWTATLNRAGSTAAVPYSWSVAGNGVNPADAADFGGTFPSGSGTFAVGETIKTGTILSSGDTTVEPDEAALMTFVTTGAGTATAPLTILNDDSASAPGVVPPSGYPATTLPFNIARVGNGTASTFTTDYNSANTKPAFTTTIYVDPAGTVGGDGLTLAAAVPSIDRAVAMCPAGGRVLVSPGIYRRSVTAAYAASGSAPSGTYGNAWTSVSVHGRPNGNIVVESSGPGVYSYVDAPLGAWAATTDANIYTATSTAGAGTLSSSAIDHAQTDRNGDPLAMYVVPFTTDEATTFAAMNAAAAKYGIGAVSRNGLKVYCRTKDSRSLVGATNVYFGRNDVFGGPGAGVLGGSYTIWLKGLTFCLGLGAFGVISSASIAPTVYRDNCAFIGGDGAGSYLWDGGPGTTIGINCRAGGGLLDGFNYHGVSGSTSNAACPLAIEIGGKSDFAGYTGTANNAYTAHEASRFIGINCDGRNSSDRAYHFIDNTRTWLPGCNGGTRRGNDGTDFSAPYAVGSGSDTGTAIMWLDDCSIVNGVDGPPTYTSEAWSGDTLYTANLPFTATAGPGTGTVTPYTPAA